MTNKEIAEIIRRGQEDELNSLANVLDPPKPEPGTVVWFRTRPDNPWVIGVALPYGITPANNIAACWNLDSDGVEWKPARIIADDEVAVKIPPVRDWPGKCDEVSLRWHQYHTGDEFMHNYAGVSITREEALRMERDG